MVLKKDCSLKRVFSTHVEVFPAQQAYLAGLNCFLHTRGGVSMYRPSLYPATRFSPHTWRCFCGYRDVFLHPRVFSTHVEVFLRPFLSMSHCSGFLHTRGGVSDARYGNLIQLPFSPHTWRCFQIRFENTVRREVFSTHVEVFLRNNRTCSCCKRFLHTRGGVSCRCTMMPVVGWFSPHTWRCFHDHTGDVLGSQVFSTHVEVFLNKECDVNMRLSFLHTRGGVSGGEGMSGKSQKFSPHTWRCFYITDFLINILVVFSTHVEVFPY